MSGRVRIEADQQLRRRRRRIQVDRQLRKLARRGSRSLERLGRAGGVVVRRRFDALVAQQDGR